MPVVINARFLTQPITGVQRFASEISKIVKTNNPEVLFVAPANIIHPALAERLEVRIIGKRTGVIWEQLELPAYLRSLNKPLLVNLANAAPLGYANQIVTIHDLGFKVNPEWYAKTFRYYYNFLIPRVARNSRKIITVSHYSKKEIVQYLQVPENKVTVIYNGVTPDFKLPITRQEQAPYLLGVSSLDPRKNFLNLVKAFNQVADTTYELRIVGTQNKIFADTQLKKLIQDNPRIILTGYVSDEKLIDLYQQATAFIYPSLYEGFGIPPLEAMACGCPTVIANVSSMPEIFRDTCHYVNPHRVDDIAQGIQVLLHNAPYRQKLIAKGLQLARRYSWHNSAAKLLEVIAAS